MNVKGKLHLNVCQTQDRQILSGLFNIYLSEYMQVCWYKDLSMWYINLGSYWEPAEDLLGPWFRLAGALQGPYRGPTGALLRCGLLGAAVCLSPPSWCTKQMRLNQQPVSEGGQPQASDSVSICGTYLSMCGDWTSNLICNVNIGTE